MGTDTKYSVFKKHTSSNTGGYDGLVPVPSYTTTNIRFLREDGTWSIPLDTDQKVLQSASTTTNFRPLILGYNNSTDKSVLANDINNQVYTTTTIYAQPNSGTLYANKFIGKIDWNNIDGKPNSFTPSSHIHNSDQITTLTSYVKTTSDSALSTSDSLNTALGKLEYKGDLGVTAYNLVNAAYDGDGTIENLKEILKVLEGIKDTETIKGLLGKYLPLTGGILTGTLTTVTTGSGEYNQGIRINRTATNQWATLLIGKSGTATSGTGTSTAGDGAWLIGTPASSNSLIFNLNNASETVGLCLKGHGNTDMRWNNNTVWHAGNDGVGSGLDADLLDGNHASAFATFGHNHDNRYVRQWAGAYGIANKFLKLLIGDEKGWIRLEVSDSNNGLTGGYGIYIVGWQWHGNNTDNLSVECLYTNRPQYTTALKVVRTSRNNYDFYFQFAENSSYPSYTINYSASVASIDCTVTAITTIPTATWTSSLSALQLNASQVDWSGITNKPSAFNPIAHTHPYLPLTGGTMTANARISHEDGNLYFGRADNNGWIMCQDLCSHNASGDNYWSLRVDGTFHARNTILSGTLGVSGITTFNINNQWLTPSVLQIGRTDDSTNTSKAIIGVTDGNLHIDSYHNKMILLNYYNRGTIRFGYQTGSYYISEDGSYYSGNASTATKLTSSAGSAILPIYFSDGKPVACAPGDTLNNMINSLSVGTDIPSDNDYYICQYAGGGTTYITYHRRPTSALYGYIKNKAEGTWNISINGNAKGLLNNGVLDSQEKIDNFLNANRFEYAIFSTDENNNVGFQANDGMILSIPWSSTNFGAQIAFDDVHSSTVKVRSKNYSWGNWYTLLHSGNYNTYAPTKTGTGASGTWPISITGNAATATNADTVDGYHATAGRTFNGNINWSDNWNDVWSDGTNSHPWYGFDHRYPNTGAYSTTISDYFGMTIKTAQTLKLDFGTLLLNGTNIYNINVASTTKLQTPRTIWGQNFDGTNNVSGDLIGAGSIYTTYDEASFYNKNNQRALIVNYRYTILGYGTAGAGLPTYIDGSPIYMRCGTSYIEALTIINNGNVGIGTTNPSYKLHVNGTLGVSSCITASSLFINTGDPTLKVYSGVITDAKSDGNICLQTSIDGTDGQSHAYPTQYNSRCNLVLQPRGGQVYIGTNPDGGNTNYKLYVNGNVYASSFTGNASTASKWATARTITLTGSVTGSALIDGSGNVSLATTTNHTHAYLPLSGGTMTEKAAISWATQNGKTPYIGQYATDGSLLISIEGTSTNNGLVFGGSSGNLLYKGNRVLDAGNYSSYALPKTGGTLTGNLTVKNIIPYSNNSYNIGSTSSRWANSYFTNSVVIGNANTSSTSTSSSMTYLYKGNIELYSNTPFIDFHQNYYNSSHSDYTARIIATAASGKYGLQLITYDNITLKTTNNKGTVSILSDLLTTRGIIPNSTDTYNIGSDTFYYNDIYTNKVIFNRNTYTVGYENVNITTFSNANIQFINETQSNHTSFYIPNISFKSTYSNSTIYWAIGTRHASYSSGEDQAFVIASSNTTVMLPNSGVNWVVPSDIRYKNIICDISITTKQLSELPLFKFIFKGQSKETLGTSAQAVQKILPELVFESDKLHLDYSTLGVISGITACKEIEKLKAQIKKLQNQLNMLLSQN